MNRIHCSDQHDDPDRSNVRGGIAQTVCAVVALLHRPGCSPRPVTVDPAGAQSSNPETRRAASRQQPDAVRVIDLRAPVKRDLGLA